MKLLDTIILKSSFPKVQSFEYELRKIGVLRIILGIVLFIRFFEIYNSVNIADEYINSKELFSISCLILIFFFTIGFLTPIATILLLFSIHWFDIKNNSGTLGTSISQILILPFAIISPGYFYSLDKYYIRKNFYYAKFLKKIDSYIGVKNSNEITRAYFFAFIIYASISFAALLFHFKDSYWMEGLTLKVMLLSSYLSKYYSFFRAIENKFPLILSSLSIIASIFQTIFQSLMIPLIFNKYGKLFIFYWGLIFFICCLFLINISYLPHVEVILWILIFKPIKDDKEIIKIIYDDFCNLCKNTIKFLKFINFSDSFDFLPLSEKKTELLNQGLSIDDISSYMCGIYKSKLIIGYDLYTLISRRAPLLYILYPIFIIGKLTQLGPYIYDFISRNRLEYFGRCELSFRSKINSNNVSRTLPKNTLFTSSLYFVYLIALLTYWCFNPNIKTSLSSSKYSKVAKRYTRKIGFNLPNVFNSTDLAMGEKWMVLQEERKGQLELIPMVGYDGERLSYEKYDILYFTNHNSDFLYFGITLPFRRKIIEMDKKSISIIMQKGNFGWINLERRIKYDYKIKKLLDKRIYKVQIFSDNSNKIKHWSSNKNIYNKKLLFQQRYSYSEEGLFRLVSADN